MASLTIVEYAGAGEASGVVTGLPLEPPAVVQSAVTIGGSSAQSAAFAGDTRLVELSTDGNCRVLVGVNPTAAAGSTYLAAGSIIHRRVTGGLKVAVIAA